MRWLVLLIGLLAVAPASAGLAPAQLDEVKAAPAIGAALPLSLRFSDVHGVNRALADIIGDTPAVVVFADYTCTNLCGPILAFAAGGLVKSGLRPGKDFHLVVIGLDPKDTPSAAVAMKASRVGNGTPLSDASVFLMGNVAALEASTQAAGYHYVYDAEHDQFAHPAAAYVIAKDGRIVRVLSGLGLTGETLRLALVDAGSGRVGTLLDQVRLHCFGFDPARGIYTASIAKILIVAAGATFFVLAGGIAFMAFARRKEAAP